MADTEPCPTRTNWFLLGTCFGLIAWPFYQILLGAPPKRRLRKA